MSRLIISHGLGSNKAVWRISAGDPRNVATQLVFLVDKALGGEDFIIAVGARRLRLVPTESAGLDDKSIPRPGYGALRGLLTIPDAFYDRLLAGQAITGGYSVLSADAVRRAFAH